MIYICLCTPIPPDLLRGRGFSILVLENVIHAKVYLNHGIYLNYIYIYTQQFRVLSVELIYDTSTFSPYLQFIPPEHPMILKINELHQHIHAVDVAIAFASRRFEERLSACTAVAWIYRG